MRALLAVLALAAADLRAEVQLSGFFLTTEASLFTLSDTDTSETSPWIGIGGSFHSCTLRSFDRGKEVLTVEKDGRLVRLHLREPRVKDGRMIVEGTLALWPEGRREGVRTSLFLGEEEALPLRPAVTLLLRAERLPDGNLLYHCRVAGPREGRPVAKVAIGAGPVPSGLAG